MTPHILIVDPDRPQATLLDKALRKKGARVTTTSSGKEGLERVLGGEVDALVCETVLEDLGGKDLILHVLSAFPGFPVFVHTAYPRVEDAFELARLGVRAYVIAGEETDDFVETVLTETAIPEFSPPANGGEAPPSGDAKTLYSRYVSRNSNTESLFKTAVERVAQATSTVLITGESGTGKELLARTIHLHSPRAAGPWVAVNCSALPESLIESELFGHEKGAFSGATRQRIGRFEQANGGTFFLDEVGDLSPAVQAKLLRVLQDHVVERLGGGDPIRVNVRIIAATHRDLDAMIRRGRFREDLFYRLSVIPLHLPPLRQRPEDIPGLARLFVERFRRETGRGVLALTPAAIHALQRHPWPGNVRELENVIERAVVLSPGNRIDVDDLPESVRSHGPTGGDPGLLKEARAHFEKEFIQRALRLQEGNISATAEAIGLARKNLQQKIKQYGIDVDALRTEQD